jgi:hypothetical protein
MRRSRWVWRCGFFGNVKSRLYLVVVVLAVLAVTGAILRGVLMPAGERRVSEPLPESPGAGALFGWLGGFKALAADFLWLRMYASWEERDLPGTQTLIRAVVAVDPRPVYFWLNGARILAYDLPAWRIAVEGGYQVVSATRRRSIEVEHARMAIRHLEAARRVQSGQASLWVEQANIELNKLGDLPAAAASYRRAWEEPRGPYYAARIYGELLRRQGKNAEALAWLRALHPQLPADVEAADAPLVLARIRELEKALAVPAERSYRPQR